MPTVVVIAAAGVLLAALVLLGFYAGQRAMLFPAPRGYISPSALDLAGLVEDPIVAEDGTRVMVWSRPADAGMPTLLHFHGNGDSLPGLAPQLGEWADAGWGVAAVSYRGYPGSGGRPSETALVGDALMVFDRLVERDRRAPSEIVISGFSLGSAVAMGVAAERKPAALFLVGAMSSIREVAKSHYPWLPVRTLMKDPFDSLARAARVEAPAMLVHGARDRVVPIRFGEALYAALPEPKRFDRVADAGHVVELREAWQAFERFLHDDGVLRTTVPQ